MGCTLCLHVCCLTTPFAWRRLLKIRTVFGFTLSSPCILFMRGHHAEKSVTTLCVTPLRYGATHSQTFRYAAVWSDSDPLSGKVWCLGMDLSLISTRAVNLKPRSFFDFILYLFTKVVCILFRSFKIKMFQIEKIFLL